jgi:hypothetical protein
MSRLTIVCLVVTSLTGLFINQVWARGRSFPIEVTGLIRAVDRTTHTFTLEVDEPATVLSIRLRYDCKFIEHGRSEGPDILQRDAHVKVSYFATIFTGNLAVEIEANPSPQIESGIVEKIELADRKLTIRTGDRPHPLTLRWTANCRFIKGSRRVSERSLRQNTLAKVSYYSPAFKSKYAVKIELEPRF